MIDDTRTYIPDAPGTTIAFGIGNRTVRTNKVRPASCLWNASVSVAVGFFSIGTLAVPDGPNAVILGDGISRASKVTTLLSNTGVSVTIGLLSFGTLTVPDGPNAVILGDGVSRASKVAALWENASVGVAVGLLSIGTLTVPDGPRTLGKGRLGSGTKRALKPSAARPIGVEAGRLDRNAKFFTITILPKAFFADALVFEGVASWACSGCGVQGRVGGTLHSALFLRSNAGSGDGVPKEAVITLAGVKIPGTRRKGDCGR